GFLPCSALGHAVEHGNLREPESAIAHDRTFESHFCSFEARRRIASASLSLISRCLGTGSSRSPSVQTSCLPPCRRKRHPRSVSRFSSSRRFIRPVGVHRSVYNYSEAWAEYLSGSLNTVHSRRWNSQETRAGQLLAGADAAAFAGPALPRLGSRDA